MSKKCTALWREAHLEVKKCTKHFRSGALLEVKMSQECTLVWREAHLEVKSCKTLQCRTAFGSGDVEKVHADVARSTCGSESVRNIAFSDHFWKLTCTCGSENVRNIAFSDHFWEVTSRKSARRCGAKHI